MFAFTGFLYALLFVCGMWLARSIDMVIATRGTREIRKALANLGVNLLVLTATVVASIKIGM